MRRLLLVLLCAVLCLSCLSCVNSEAPTEPTGTSQGEAESTEATEKEEQSELEATFCVPVATGVCVVGGICSADCESVSVSAPGVEPVTITPDLNSEGGYFFGQVHVNEDCTLTLTAQTGEGTATDTVEARYREMENLMTSDEYMPVFGNDSRMHFYSSLLAYSLSDFVTDSMKTRTEKVISDSVRAIERVNPETELIYLVVPSSAAVYSEGVGEDYPPAEGESLYDVFETIATECGAKVIYPLDTFLENRDIKQGYKIYHNTDSHWTAYGAYLGVSELMEYISASYPAAAPRSEEEMGFYLTELWGGDALFSFGDNSGFEDFSATGRTGKTEITGINELTTMFSLETPTATLKSVYRGGKSTYVNGDSNSGKATVVNRNGEGLPTALIYRDSFSCPAYDIVNDRFSTVWWQPSHNYALAADAVAEYKPDYVIYLVSERNLLKVMMANANANLLNYVEDNK